MDKKSGWLPLELKKSSFRYDLDFLVNNGAAEPGLQEAGIRSQSRNVMRLRL
jgi:hypothetical protein